MLQHVSNSSIVKRTVLKETMCKRGRENIKLQTQEKQYSIVWPLVDADYYYLG